MLGLISLGRPCLELQSNLCSSSPRKSEKYDWSACRLDPPLHRRWFEDTAHSVATSVMEFTQSAMSGAAPVGGTAPYESAEVRLAGSCTRRM